MEKSVDDARDERRLQILKKYVEVDRLTPSPSERAKYIYDKLNALDPKPTHWDLVCFCAETLGMLTFELPVTNKYVAAALRTIYEVHYYSGEDNPTCLPRQQQNQNSTISPTSKTENSSDQTGASPLSDLVIEKSQSVVLELKDY